METLVESCLNIKVVEVAGRLEPQNLGLLCLPPPLMHTRSVLQQKNLDLLVQRKREHTY